MNDNWIIRWIDEQTGEIHAEVIIHVVEVDANTGKILKTERELIEYNHRAFMDVTESGKYYLETRLELEKD